MATKKTAAKKSTAKKSASEDTGDTPAKKSPAKKAPAKRSAAKRSSSAPRTESSPRKRRGPEIAADAARQLVELTGRDVEGVTSLERTDDGWRVEVEVLEVRRIPDTTDVLATYELTLDEDGDIEGYRRLHRYVRGTPGEEQRR
nr:gas vesicle protein GvpO [uncultured Nocardioides sp.]